MPYPACWRMEVLQLLDKTRFAEIGPHFLTPRQTLFLLLYRRIHFSACCPDASAADLSLHPKPLNSLRPHHPYWFAFLQNNFVEPPRSRCFLGEIARRGECQNLWH